VSAAISRIIAVARAAASFERRVLARAAEYAGRGALADDLAAVFVVRACPASAAGLPSITESARVPIQKKGFLFTQPVPDL
jgi:hypothetical protein